MNMMEKRKKLSKVGINGIRKELTKEAGKMLIL